jgi:hypothetical protein
MYAIYCLRGAEIFRDEAKKSLINTVFALFAKHVAKFTGMYDEDDPISFCELYSRHDMLSDGSKKRYRVTLFEPEQIAALALPHSLGCDYAKCPDRIRLSRLLTRKLSKWSQESRQLLEHWGHDLKLCAS